MIHLPALLAVQDFIDTFLIKEVQESDNTNTAIITLEANNKVSVIKVDKKSIGVVNNFSLYLRMLLSNTILSRATKEELITCGEYYIERVIQENLKSSTLLKQNGQLLLNYSIGNRKVINKPILPFNKDLVISSKLIRDGYSIEERKGLHIAVITPSGVQRTVTDKTCNCKEFLEVNKEKSPCMHLTLLKVFLENRALFYKYNVLTYID